MARSTSGASASPQVFYACSRARRSLVSGRRRDPRRDAGLYIGFFVAPADAVQSEAYRIIFIHVPASILSMFIYLIMAGYAALGLIFNTRLSSMMASALAPTGALFAFISP